MSDDLVRWLRKEADEWDEPKHNDEVDMRGMLNKVADTIEAQTAEIERLIPMVKDALEKGRHRLLKEGFSPQDPTVRAMNEAIRALGETE